MQGQDRAAGWSQGLLHRLLQAELASGGDDGHAVLQVVVDEVADAVKDPVFRPDLGGTQRAGKHDTQADERERTCSEPARPWEPEQRLPRAPTLLETCLQSPLSLSPAGQFSRSSVTHLQQPPWAPPTPPLLAVSPLLPSCP